mgnify:CR=1 FL=1
MAVTIVSQFVHTRKQSRPSCAGQVIEVARPCYSDFTPIIGLLNPDGKSWTKSADDFFRFFILDPQTPAHNLCVVQTQPSNKSSGPRRPDMPRNWTTYKMDGTGVGPSLRGDPANESSEYTRPRRKRNPPRKYVIQSTFGNARSPRSRKNRPCDGCRTRKTACVITSEPPCKHHPQDCH